MKSITSKADPFKFVYDSNNVLEIGEEPITVTDEIAAVVEHRYGALVNIEDVAGGSDADTGKDEGDTGPSHADLKARAKELGLKQGGKKEDLVARIAEEEARIAAEAEGAATLPEGKKVATQEDLDADPSLEESGVKVGDVIDAPAAE